ncbi:type II toxin-antitoxin system RelB family antitoxin [Pseudolactococcus reticulitermitis]|uniref:Antitoxin n=1 Tax=Pseudolactococcus reticulitermitis TaxID=2025039 RepID=A0A224X856_9LACT|nr:DUF6290 family protein [Lactococcus reticulitermitis]GAX46434.1 hypothetical protein RsY01_13 [Lactococcus reticulitermitis]GHU43695.1 hypothetical protein FACS1894193_10970 [Bacilli bacterium]
MATITIKVQDSEKQFFQAMAKFEGLSLSESIKRTMLEKYENEYDLKLAETSVAEFQEYIVTGKPVQSWEDLQAELGLDDDL